VLRNLISLAGAASAPAGRPSDLPSPHTLVLAGALDDNRLMPQLVDAVALLASRWPQIHLLCFSELAEDDYGRSLLERARARGVTERVTLRPRIPWERLQGYLAASVAGLVLYSDRQNNRFGLPNRLFEFMRQGVPIVATDFPLVRQIVDDARCGILLDSGRPDGIAAGVEKVLADPAGARGMGERGREAILDKYNWEREYPRLEALYAELVPEPSSN
jgi:glycosyltransferase involved in cell wall biosynthesis